MARETECPVCNAYIPVDDDIRPGDYIYCSYCGAQLRVGETRAEDGEDVEVEEEWD